MKKGARKLMPPGSAVQLGILYRFPLSQDVLPMADDKGSLPNGKTYQIISIDETSVAEGENGNRHFYIYCSSDGRDVGHVHFWLGDRHITEFETMFHFDGWYLYDAYVDPQFRRNGIYQLLTEHGLKIARETEYNGQYVSAFTECSRSVSGRALKRMGFKAESKFIFIKLPGYKRLIKTALVL